MTGSLSFAVDIDDTIAETNKCWAKMLVREGLVDLYRDLLADLTRYRYIRCVPYMNQNEAFLQMVVLPTMERILPVDGASEVLMQWQSHFSAYVSTRPEAHRNAIRSWLYENHFPEMDLYLCPLSQQSNPLLWKANLIFKEYPRISGIIDDCSDLLQILHGSYMGHLVHFRPADSDVCLEGVKQLTSWRALSAAFIKEASYE